MWKMVHFRKNKKLQLLSFFKKLKVFVNAEAEPNVES